jgi:hypothetical protein
MSVGIVHGHDVCGMSLRKRATTSMSGVGNPSSTRRRVVVLVLYGARSEVRNGAVFHPLHLLARSASAVSSEHDRQAGISCSALHCLYGRQLSSAEVSQEQQRHFPLGMASGQECPVGYTRHVLRVVRLHSKAWLSMLGFASAVNPAFRPSSQVENAGENGFGLHDNERRRVTRKKRSNYVSILPGGGCRVAVPAKQAYGRPTE